LLLFWGMPSIINKNIYTNYFFNELILQSSITLISDKDRNMVGLIFLAAFRDI